MAEGVKRRKAKPRVWNLARAVHWLKTVGPAGPDEEPEELEPEWETGPSSPFGLADGLDAVVDAEDGRLRGFEFSVRPADERVESFCVDMPWGCCRIEGTPADDELVWTCDSPLDDDGASDDLAQEFQDLMHRRYRPAWTDPRTQWCPEAADELPCGWIEDELAHLAKDARLVVGRSEDGEEEGLYVVRGEADFARLAKRLADLRELSVDEAVAYVDEHYGDCFDWPSSLED